MMFGVHARTALLALSILLFAACDSPERKECLQTCASAEAKIALCSGPRGDICKKELTELVGECEKLCEEQVK